MLNVEHCNIHIIHTLIKLTMAPSLSLRERKKITDLYSYYRHYKGLQKIETVQRIADRLLYSKNCVLKYVNLHLKTRQLKSYHERHGITHGRPRGYNNDQLVILERIIRAKSELYLTEIQYELMKHARTHFNISTIVRMIEKLRISRKRICKTGFHFRLRNVKLYQLNLKLQKIRKNQLVFTDESYYHDRIANRNYGRSLRYANKINLIYKSLIIIQK